MHQGLLYSLKNGLFLTTWVVADANDLVLSKKSPPVWSSELLHFLTYPRVSMLCSVTSP